MSRLDLELLIWRSKWLPWLAALMLLAAAGVHEMVTVRLAEREAHWKQSAEAIRLTSPAPPVLSKPEKPQIEARYDAFRAALGAKEEMNQQVTRLFAEAEKRALVLTQAEYKLDFDKAGGFWTYQINLPVRGPYPQLRRFVDESLQANPNAALEQVDIKRDGIGARAAEVKLRFVLYLKDSGL
jgi:hypothetical protein